MRSTMPSHAALVIGVTVFLGSIAWAGDPPATDAPNSLLRSIYSVPIDGPTSDRIRVVTGAETEDAVVAFAQAANAENPQLTVPRPPAITRAVGLVAVLRETFGGRLVLAQVDLTVAGRVEYGLAVNGNITKDLTNLRKVRESLARYETVTAIESGSYRQDGHIDDATLAALAESFPFVRALHLVRCPVTAESLMTVGKWTGLEQLKIRRANLSGKPLTPLGNLTELRTVELLETSTSGSLEFLKGLRKLERLFCQTDDANAKWVGTLTQLRTLDLCGSRITDAGLTQIADLTRLEWLGLQNSNITDAGLVHVSKMTRLHFLNLSGTRLTGQGLAALKDLPLSQLEMQNTSLTGENWMRHVPAFKSYDGGLMMITRDSQVTPEEAARIRTMLKKDSQAFLNGR